MILHYVMLFSSIYYSLFYFQIRISLITYLYNYSLFFFFFFSSRRRHTRCLSDWSSDVCSSDLAISVAAPVAIIGTLIVTGAATLIAVPLGVLGAVYLHEYGRGGPLARLVRFMAMVMTGVPSIVMGLFVYVMWTMRFGYSAFGGALALACLMLPVVIGSAEPMLRLVPNHM